MITTTFLIGERMKILIVGSPRTGTTYLLHVLARYFMHDITKDMPNVNHENFITVMDKFLDEPFSDFNSVFEIKQKFDTIMKLPSWVIKIHSSHITTDTNKWITRLYKDADIIVKLTRKDIRGTMLSHCIAMTKKSYTDNHGTVYVDPQIVHDSIVCAYSDQVTLQNVPYDIQIDYDDLKKMTPDEILFYITGLNREVDWKLNKLPKKNTATISNIHQVDDIYQKWMARRLKLAQYNKDNY